MPHNTIISASAGSGKTHQLTNRFLKLLALGEEPERIVALTFTRKAAGEFLTRILTRLAKSATGEKAARDLAGEIGVPSLSLEKTRALLKKLVRQMPRLQLSTLDSFMLRILSAFSMEFGISGALKVYESKENDAQKQRVIHDVFTFPGAQKDILPRIFKDIHQTKPSIKIHKTVEEYINAYHRLIEYAPSEDVWGNAERIWPTPPSWKNAKGSPVELIEKLLDELEKNHTDEKIMQFWEELAEEIRAGKTTPLPKRLDYFLKPACLGSAYASLEKEGSATIKVNRKKHSLEGKVAQLVHALFASLLGKELERCLSETQSIWHIMSSYEGIYDKALRQKGVLNFSDILFLLWKSREHTRRLDIDFRLDGRMDHWLFDEFQDTSRTQWQAIQNLVDEAIQDPEKKRSVFIVGDTKQAIYHWRGGDERLLKDLEDYYGQDVFEKKSLAQSWRSAPAVIETLNTIFGNDAALKSLLPKDVIERWQWEPHTTTEKNETLSGELAFWEVQAEGSSPADYQDACQSATIQILRDLQPRKHGLQCAILLRKNKSVEEYVDAIRKVFSDEELSVLSQSENTPFTDNAPCIALLSLFHLAAHPSDNFAWQYICMTPLGDLFKAEGQKNTASFILEKIHHEGFSQTLSDCLNELSEIHPLDTFAHQRVQKLLHFTIAYEQQNTGRNIDAFVQSAKTATSKESTPSCDVQVMTIHKSKGLEFDCVILPELFGDALTTQHSKAPFVGEEERGQAHWILERATQDPWFALDETLHAAHLLQKSHNVYEGLCRLYVAMTRAQQALHLIIPAKKSTRASSINEAELLRQTLPLNDDAPMDNTNRRLLYHAGEARWFEKKENKPAEQPIEENALEPPLNAITLHQRNIKPGEATLPRLPRRLASAQKQETWTNPFKQDTKFAKKHGQNVHALLEKIEWYDGGDKNILKEKITATSFTLPIEEFQPAWEEVSNFLNTPEIIALFTKPNTPFWLWRERAIEAVIDGAWWTGVMDRAVIYVNEKQEPQSALLLDFKTDRKISAETIARYRKQLEAYQFALSKVLGLPLEKISPRIAFTKQQKIVRL